jgi:hypothetical protein
MTRSVDDARPIALRRFDDHHEEDPGRPSDTEDHDSPPGVAAWFTVIVPTRNEAGNVKRC